MSCWTSSFFFSSAAVVRWLGLVLRLWLELQGGGKAFCKSGEAGLMLVVIGAFPAAGGLDFLVWGSLVIVLQAG
jgi:hypothetical protein